MNGYGLSFAERLVSAGEYLHHQRDARDIARYMAVAVHESLPSADGVTICVGIEDMEAYAVLGVLGYPSFPSTMVVDAGDRLVSAMGRELCLKSAKTVRETLVSDDPSVQERMRSSFAGSHEPHQMLGQPIRLGERLLGALWVSVWTPGRAFDGADVSKLRLLGRVLTIALDDADYATIYRKDGQSSAYRLKRQAQAVEMMPTDQTESGNNAVNMQLGETSASIPSDLFSERELMVLRLIGAGMTSREIAGQLFISPNTVRTHRTNLLNKLGVHSSAAAVARARQLGLIR